ncbi:MAG TPA: lipoyl synthase [Thermoplasmata archaeon]|nr:lipoyl synthase [Thermoplasmata archaeon]
MLAERKPEWLRVRPPAGENYAHVKTLLRDLGLHTVCAEAHCPNVAECWGGGTATIMLLGDLCTRGCRFCAVRSGNPHGLVDGGEPGKVAAAVADLGLSYVVLTSVDRDDLPDGGAAHFAATIHEIKARDSDILVEALIPDFQGDLEAVRTVVEARPDVLDHNIETVRRLQSVARDPRATYAQSLAVLKGAKAMRADLVTKSSIMLGLGETREEILTTMRDLRANEVDLLTLGQYLRPSEWHLPVHEYVAPETFDEFREAGEAMGFLYVAAGPLVRSSYRAGEFFLERVIRERRAPAAG